MTEARPAMVTDAPDDEPPMTVDQIMADWSVGDMDAGGTIARLEFVARKAERALAMHQSAMNGDVVELREYLKKPYGGGSDNHGS